MWFMVKVVVSHKRKVIFLTQKFYAFGSLGSEVKIVVTLSWKSSELLQEPHYA